MSTKRDLFDMFTPTQAEITRAYYEGTDPMEKYRRRYIVAQVLGATAITVAALVMLYLTKSAMGIDLFDYHACDLVDICSNL